MNDLRAPFPYFGGKLRAAPLIWSALGRVSNYVEPFFGSGAVLLARPRECWATPDGPGTETVNDASRFLANFWRALAADPEAVARWADWPVNECAPAGTMIATPLGDIPIERIKPGMVVWGEADGRRVPTEVLAIKRDHASEFVMVGELRVTGNHPVWTSGRGYVQASDLTAGEYVKIVDWGATETDLRMLYTDDDKSAMGSVWSERSADGETSVHRGDFSRAPEVERAPVQGCNRHGSDAPGLLAALACEAGIASQPFSIGAGCGRWLARSGAVLDCPAPSVWGSCESHGWRRGNVGLRTDARAQSEVVSNAERCEVPARTAQCDAGQTPQYECLSPHRGGIDGQTSLPANAGAHVADCGSARSATEHNRGIRDVPTRRPADGRASSEDCGDNHEQEACCLRRGGQLVSVDHGSGPRVGGQRSVGLSGHPKGLLLQRESLPAGVAVHNFETGTGNYFAAGILVHNCDLHARHRWLVDALPALSAAMQSDPDHFDAKIAGWWVWGQCSWIGTGWCDELPAQLPHLGNAGQGVHRKLPHLGNAGQGVHRKLPHLGDAGRGDLLAYLSSLSDRLRRVRVSCGDWSRVCGDSVTWRHGLTGVLLDPPYAEGAQQYAAGGTGSTLSADVRAWAIEVGKRPDMRVVLCGLEGEHDMPASWRCVPWKARGGYGSQRADGGNENRHRERLWFSPHCNNATKQGSLF